MFGAFRLRYGALLYVAIFLSYSTPVVRGGHHMSLSRASANPGGSCPRLLAELCGLGAAG